MDEHTSHELAYKKGYEQGKQDALKWIPVTERLPEDGANVLCCYYGMFGQIVRIATFSNYLEGVDEYDFAGCKYSGFYCCHSEWGYYELEDVTHWMPLPTPPKGE